MPAMAVRRFPRILLGLSAVILAVSGVMHGLAFGELLRALTGAGLTRFYAQSFKVLWLSNSVVLLVVSAVFAYLAVRPEAARGAVVMLLAVIPAMTATLLYRWAGNVVPAHMLLAATVAAVFAGIGYHRP